MTPKFDDTLPLTTLKGETVTMAAYTGQVLLIVNVASRCGFTPQYAELENLWQRYQARGLMVLGFPCNQFAHQEPGDAAEIAAFCSLNYGVTFPIFQKIEVNGAQTHPLYQWLKASAPGLLGTEAIKWNFTKFLVSRDRNTVRRFAPKVSPQTLGPTIETWL